jgi:hypothetical protein
LESSFDAVLHLQMRLAIEIKISETSVRELNDTTTCDVKRAMELQDHSDNKVKSGRVPGKLKASANEDKSC